MNIHIVQNQTIQINSQSVISLIQEFASFYKVKFDEATVHFVDTAAISELHKEYFDDPTTTDCISFPMDDDSEEGYRILGEVFVCPETAVSFVKENGGDIYEEMTLYVVHGFLHLIGFDDIDDVDRKIMRAEEAKFLSNVSAKSLWINRKSEL